MTCKNQFFCVVTQSVCDIFKEWMSHFGTKGYLGGMRQAHCWDRHAHQRRVKFKLSCSCVITDKRPVAEESLA